jgi:hypothetical protein
MSSRLNPYLKCPDRGGFSGVRLSKAVTDGEGPAGFLPVRAQYGKGSIFQRW